MLQVFGVKLLDRLVTQDIITDGTDGIGIVAELTGMISEICGRSAQLAAIGQTIP